ncbi:hypothetical protein NE237_025987 [Protea cynaroides]|uniref:Phytocyanin domain-containing protein n=1 Tax=Protea cynaroides TaxID=273540 RepID=A0A9Q0K0R3_9MAGN|nr:hypothetical protein NE237_025987 [Protea cynaroides]
MDTKVVWKMAAVMVIAALQLHCAHGLFTRAPTPWGGPFLQMAPATYTAWATNKTFLVGDTLQFNLVTGKHTVVTLSKIEQFDSCTSNYYFICTFPRHCNNGQKLSVNVTDLATPSILSPPSSPSSMTCSTPSSPSSTSSAPSSTVGVMGFFVTCLLSITIVAFFL